MAGQRFPPSRRCQCHSGLQCLRGRLLEGSALRVHVPRRPSTQREGSSIRTCEAHMRHRFPDVARLKLMGPTHRIPRHHAWESCAGSGSRLATHLPRASGMIAAVRARASVATGQVGCARTRWAADTMGVTNGARAPRTWAPVVRWRRRAPWLDNLQACACTGVSEAPAPATVQAVREEPRVSRSGRWIGRGRGRLPTSLAKEMGWQLRGTFLYAWESVFQRRLELPQSTCQGLNLGRSGVSS